MLTVYPSTTQVVLVATDIDDASAWVERHAVVGPISFVTRDEALEWATPLQRVYVSERENSDPRHYEVREHLAGMMVPPPSVLRPIVEFG